MMGVSEPSEGQSWTALGFQQGVDAFADVSNLEHCVKYLNQALTTFGFPSTLHLFSNDPAAVAQTCNCLYALLQQRQRDIEFRDSANDQKQRLMSDMARLEAKLERLDSQLVAKERELATLTSKEQKAAAAFKAQLEKLQQERDEFQRLVVSTQQVRVQQSHELKKREKEYAKLQEKLNQVLVEKKKETKPALEMLTLLQKEGRQRGTWNSKKADGDFTKMIVDAYELKKAGAYGREYGTTISSPVYAGVFNGVINEVSDMRDFLNSPMGRASSVNGSFEGDRPSTPSAGRTDWFDLPFHMARDQIEQSLRTKMASIRERMLQLHESEQSLRNKNEANNRERELEAQLAEARVSNIEQISTVNKQVADDPRTPSAIHAVNSGAVPVTKWDEDEFDSDEWSTPLEDAHFSKNTTPRFERERFETTKAKEIRQNHMGPENSVYPLELANVAFEVSESCIESEGPARDPPMASIKANVDIREDQTASFEPSESSTDKTRLVDLQRLFSHRQRVQTKSKKESSRFTMPANDRSFRYVDWNLSREGLEFFPDVDNRLSDPEPEKSVTTSHAVWAGSSASPGENFGLTMLKGAENCPVVRPSHPCDDQVVTTTVAHLSELGDSELVENPTSRRNTVEKDEEFEGPGLYGSRSLAESRCKRDDLVCEVRKARSHRLLGDSANRHELPFKHSDTVLVELLDSQFRGRSHSMSGPTVESSIITPCRTDTAAGFIGEAYLELYRDPPERQPSQSEISSALPDSLSRVVPGSFSASARSWSSRKQSVEHKIHPVFCNIADNAWVDDSESIQTSKVRLGGRTSFNNVHCQSSPSLSSKDSGRTGFVHDDYVSSTPEVKLKKRSGRQSLCGCFRF